MTIDLTSVFKSILTVSIVLVGLVAAFFYLLEHYQKPESKKVRKWLEDKWSKIDVNKWYELLSKALGLFLKLRRLPEHVLYFLFGMPKYILFFLLCLFALFPSVISTLSESFEFLGKLSLIIQKPSILNNPSIATIIIASFFMFNIYLFITESENAISKSSVVLLKVFIAPILLVLFLYLLIPSFVSTFKLYLINYSHIIDIILTNTTLLLRVYSISFIILIILSVCISALIVILSSIIIIETYFKNYHDKIIGVPSIVWISFTMSIIASSIAMALGYITASNSHEVTQISLILSNFVFDYFTLIFSFWIIKKALQSKSALAIPVAIVLDLLLAFLFALGSLYFGLLPTAQSLTISEVFLVFFGGGTLDCPTCSRDAYFFLMHTTFVPTLVYMSFIVFFWLGKLTLKLSDFLLVPKKSLKRPYGLCRALCLVISGLLLLIRVVVELL